MKKSKIIIPAAAILALSVGASVTGTVAWFTASRRTNVTVNNLAVINAQGALSVTNTKVTGCTIESGNVKLNYLQDASYDQVNDKAYVAVLDTDGSLVIGSRLVDKLSFRTLTTEKAGTQDIYYISQWTSKFETTSQETQYLFFDNSLAKSNISGTVNDSSVYKSLRVSMVNGDFRILWAPYTGESTIYYLNKAVSLAEEKQYDVDGTVKDESTEKQDVAAAFGDAVTGKTPLVETSSVKEGSSVTADQDKLCLSKTFKNDSSVTITTTVWFEGLDQNCIATSSDLNLISGEVYNRILTLSYYAVAANAITPYSA